VERALTAPLRQIAENAGFEGGVVIEHVKAGKNGFGFNAMSGEYEDLIQAGVIDPAKVTRSTIQNAASIAALLITTEALIGEVKEDTPPAMPPGGGMEGMGDF
jgi:chaperonin GroEL